MAADASPEPYFSFDACTVRPADYRYTVALALDGSWRQSPTGQSTDTTAHVRTDEPGPTAVFEVGPWGLRVRLAGEVDPLLLFFEQGEVWDFDPPPWMPRPDPASRVSENHRLEIELPCPQHRLPRLYGAGRIGADATLELFLTVLSPDKIMGRAILRDDAGTHRQPVTLERYSSSP
ncbi:MAG: hypothetical protein AAFP17_13800 [Pseudomonadota bacterium]